MHLDQFQFVISSKMAEPSNSLMPCEMIQRKSLFNHNTEIRKLSACAFCFVFMIIELVGCSLANSLVIATNVLCLWSDVTSYLISMAALLLIAERQSTDNRWSGHYRAEVCAFRVLSPLTPRPSSNYFLFQVLGAFASVIGTWFVAIFLGYLAIGRLLEGSIKIDSFIMMITATLGLLANLL